MMTALKRWALEIWARYAANEYVKSSWNVGAHFGGCSQMQLGFFRSMLQIVQLYSGNARAAACQGGDPLPDGDGAVGEHSVGYRRRSALGPMVLFKGPVLQHAKQAMRLKIRVMDRVALSESPTTSLNPGGLYHIHTPDGCGFASTFVETEAGC
jgi:hypothetical protein